MERGIVEPAGQDGRAEDSTAEVGSWRSYPPLDLPKILEVALRQIGDHGYDAITVRSLAREVGVTVPALYYHYENKQAILVALLEHAMELVTSHVEAALAEAGPDPVDQLSAVVEAICLYMAHHSDLAFLDSERRSLTPENLRPYLDHRDQIDERLRTIIEEGCRTGAFATPVPQAARHAILSMCQGIAGWYRGGGPKSPATTAREFVQVALAAVQSTR